MKSTRFVSAVLGHGLVAAALVCCGGSNPSTGVTNTQAPDTPGVAPGNQCLSRGAECLRNNDCCSEWCANGVCVPKHP
jgi:hypothetical protein